MASKDERAHDVAHNVDASAEATRAQPVKPFFGQIATVDIGTKLTPEDVSQAKVVLGWPLTRWAEYCCELSARPHEQDAIWTAQGINRPEVRNYIKRAWMDRINGDKALRAEFDAVIGQIGLPGASNGGLDAEQKRTVAMMAVDFLAKPVSQSGSDLTDAAPPPTRPPARSYGPSFAERLSGEGPTPRPPDPNQDVTLTIKRPVAPAPFGPRHAQCPNPSAVADELIQGSGARDRVREALEWPLEKWALACAQLEHDLEFAQQTWEVWGFAEPELQQRISESWTAYIQSDAELKQRFDKLRKRHQARIRRNLRS